MHAPTYIFWANLTPFSREMAVGSLPAFLIGAGEGSFYGCSRAWTFRTGWNQFCELAAVSVVGGHNLVCNSWLSFGTLGDARFGVGWLLGYTQTRNTPRS
jgi:hypothetical protein